MRRHALVFLAVGGLLAAAAETRDEALKSLEGTWVTTGVEIGGNKVPAETIKQMPGRVTIAAGKYTLKAGERSDTGTIAVVDAGKKPKQMDIKPADGPLAGKTLAAIYEVDGETLKVCYAPPDQARPTSFNTKDKPGYMAIEYKREKPAK